MTRLFFLLLSLFSIGSYSQTLNLNNPLFENNLRRAQLNGDVSSNISFTLRPLDLNNYDVDKDIFDFNVNYSSHHPYNRNNGSMITNAGYQQLISAGLYFELGPLSIQLKPENIYAENRDYDGFWEGHYDVIWARRYILWNLSLIHI